MVGGVIFPVRGLVKLGGREMRLSEALQLSPSPIVVECFSGDGEKMGE